ncbi:CP12 domain-containing protein 1 [Carex rostrata]
MAASLSSMTTLSTPTSVRLLNISNPYPSSPSQVRLLPCTTRHYTRLVVRSTPSEIAKKVSESIKQAEETCADNPSAGECVAAWDEVEELSAAASHARDKNKTKDPLEEYCKDNPETDECRTYED